MLREQTHFLSPLMLDNIGLKSSMFRAKIYKLSFEFKGIQCQFYKLGLKVPSGRDENDGIGHSAELGSSWPGEAKTWLKIALRVGGRAEKYCVGGQAAGRYWAAPERATQSCR